MVALCWTAPLAAFMGEQRAGAEWVGTRSGSPESTTFWGGLCGRSEAEDGEHDFLGARGAADPGRPRGLKRGVVAAGKKVARSHCRPGRLPLVSPLSKAEARLSRNGCLTTLVRSTPSRPSADRQFGFLRRKLPPDMRAQRIAADPP